jgi:HAD superfamily hydrolase (TIGR01509 family)
LRHHAALVPAAVIFDNDGLTLDTEQAWTRAETELFARHGAVFTMQHKRDLLGCSRSIAAGKLERHLRMPGRGEALMDEMHDIVMQEVLQGAPPMPGVVELLRALREAGTPVALASNSSTEFIARALVTGGVEGCFDAVVTADDVERPKPAPDVYLAAASALGVAPGECVALEDSRTGVAAARAAGMTVIGVPSLPGVELSEAHHVARSVADAHVWEIVGLAPDGGPVR